MFQSLSSRLLIAVLLAAGLPFGVFVYFVAQFVERRITADNVELFLESKVFDVADKINRSLRERERDLALWSGERTAVQALQDSTPPDARDDLQQSIHLFFRSRDAYKLVMVFDRAGRPVSWNTVQRDGNPLSEPLQKRLAGADVYNEPWFQQAIGGARVGIDWHRNPLVVEDVSRRSIEPADYCYGFATPVSDPVTGLILGAVVLLVDWSSVQVEILDTVAVPVTSELRTSLQQYGAGYAFLWQSDANRIIGHHKRQLYDTRVSDDVKLPELSREVASNPNRIIQYEYPPGTQKRAAFRQTLRSGEGGFGWIVGIGVEDEVVFAPARLVRMVLIAGAGSGVAALALCLFVISRAITRPLTELAGEADKIARGELDARVRPAGPVETRTLGRSFNHMAEELARSRERLVRAEKEAAWREMARQVSHEIKNPLTPLKMSLTLLDRAWKDRSPDFENILQKSISLMDRQIESLRQIAVDFKTFAGAPDRRTETVRLSELVDEVILLYSAQAAERNIKISRSGGNGAVRGDQAELKRALVNFVDNAMAAAPEHGEINIAIEVAGRCIRVVVHDDGPGIPVEAREKLFTPYFSTKTQGTGLGLAIVRRIAEDHNGRAWHDTTVANGTAMVLELPLFTSNENKLQA